MPTSLTYKSLAAGQLPATKGTLYTTPALTETAIKTIVITNNGGGDNTVNLYAKVLGGVTEAHFYSVILSTGDTVFINDFGTLTAADLIEGSATNATQVDYLVLGAEAV